ncbi:hypothetical protein SAMN05421752_101446 [Natronorubrum thiooxidans]|uniref:C2H2-type domain-containing protein n=2 Tax=Natronorubrum thiooxidans TaxID=308853 RepID=A0A1N7CM90_9EURY|nr:hypothetical protein SAMN05421752_101446 [Natronorubrum thiooxidans]
MPSMPTQTETCPLCAYTGETATDVYTHLQTSHRKSAISTRLLEHQSRSRQR